MSALHGAANLLDDGDPVVFYAGRMKMLSPLLALFFSFGISLTAAPALKDKPFLLYPACPCYHAVLEGNGDTRIDARVNLEPEQRAGLRLIVELTDASGKQLQTASADASTGEIVGVNLRVPNQS